MVDVHSVVFVTRDDTPDGCVEAIITTTSRRPLHLSCDFTRELRVWKPPLDSSSPSGCNFLKGAFDRPWISIVSSKDKLLKAFEAMHVDFDTALIERLTMTYNAQALINTVIKAYLYGSSTVLR